MNWIKASEKLPDYGERVLCAFSHNDLYLRGRASYDRVVVSMRTHTDKQGEHYTEGEAKFAGSNPLRLVAWMPMPRHPDKIGGEILTWPTP